VFPDPKRTMAIAKFPVPTDLTSLRGFLGLVNQLGHFFARFGTSDSGFVAVAEERCRFYVVAATSGSV
jgi:hypothetical protein